MHLTDQIKSTIRDVDGYPRPGIVFKDITPVLGNPPLLRAIIAEMVTYYQDKDIHAVAGIEARGFILGSILAHQLGCSFVPVRKSGKLPFKTRKERYDLEYGSGEIEIHSDAIGRGSRVLVHDDLLATGGTAVAAGRLVEALGGQLAGFSFLINLGFLPGEKKLHEQFGHAAHFLVKY